MFTREQVFFAWVISFIPHQSFEVGGIIVDGEMRLREVE